MALAVRKERSTQFRRISMSNAVSALHLKNSCQSKKRKCRRMNEESMSKIFLAFASSNCLTVSFPFFSTSRIFIAPVKNCMKYKIHATFHWNWHNFWDEAFYFLKMLNQANEDNFIVECFFVTNNFGYFAFSLV